MFMIDASIASPITHMVINKYCLPLILGLRFICDSILDLCREEGGGGITDD